MLFVFIYTILLRKIRKCLLKSLPHAEDPWRALDNYIDVKVSYNVVLVCHFPLWLSYKEQRFLPVLSNDVLKFGGTTRVFGKENL